MKADLLMQRAGQSLHCECSLQEQAERARHPYAHGCAWVSERQKICHYGEVRDLSFSECCRSLCFAFGIFVFFRCKSKKLAPLCFICFNSQVFFFFVFFLLWYTNKLPLLKAAVFTFIVVDQNVCDGSGWVACIDELYSPQLYGYGSRSQLSLTSCPAAADSCSHWLSSDKHIACIPARHQTAAWKSNLITRQENQYFRILHSPRSLFYYRSHSHALHICAFQ